jgi:hypothetical protein
VTISSRVYGRDQAIQNIQRELKVWKIAPSEAGEVMAKTASNYVDSDAWRADVALRLLVDLGADVERAPAIVPGSHDQSPSV